MTVRGTTATGTELAATEFRDFLRVSHDVTLTNLQNKFDGLSYYFDIRHELSYRNWGLVIARHK